MTFSVSLCFYNILYFLTSFLQKRFLANWFISGKNDFQLHIDPPRCDHYFCVGVTLRLQHDFNINQNFLVFNYCIFTGAKSNWNFKDNWLYSTYYCFPSIAQFEFSLSWNKSNQRKFRYTLLLLVLLYIPF